ncbi:MULTISPECIES: HlyD family efflux transporter periplasmic adaptor subunit [Calothrix]|uniref:HlyD family efflux transporter periplasmic adaptor subunit n=2 Tax=Calothrix TaxID=1186 RepID=A0ABR8A4N1_9CYAN|nr:MULTISPECIES: HlyD family efflux transporter periplasmic adaptor subunit [Calothrix]MBD2194916.1 HlyD family efflux transporter periplasmic adaptor subunit [Calothrix parietina FACHB-288]MBD2223514.1 HlyD family efflux transporter periplasmic adaptor subunit [Calothrix anomala FACHB-343]
MKQPLKSLVARHVESSAIKKKSLDADDQLLDLAEETAYLYGGTAASAEVATEQRHNFPDDFSPATPQAVPPKSGDWSASLQTVLDDPPSALPYHILLAGILFGISVMVWATVGQIDEVGKASGRLVPQGKPYKINTVVSGKVARLDVKEGDTVIRGQVIAQLDREIAVNEVERLAQEIASYKTQLIQTQVLIDKTQLEAKTRLAINNAEIKAQEAVINQAQAKIESQKVAIAQGQQRAEINKSLVAQLNVAASAEQERLERLKSLADQGAISKDQIFQAQQNLGDRQRTITQQIGESQQTLTESKRLQADLRQVLAEAQQLQEQLAQKQAEGNTVQIQTQQTIQKLQVEKTQLYAKMQQTEKLLQQSKALLKQLSLAAPVNGMILSLNIKNSGEVVQPGQIIAEVAPENAPLILETVLPTQEAGFIKVGNSAKVKFDAYPYQDYGVITGKVISISPDSQPDEKLGAVYRVGIALDRNYVKTRQQTIQFKPGQTASAEIIIRRRRIADMLLEPIKQLQKGGLNL